MKKKNQKIEDKTYKSDEVMSMLENINDGIHVISEQHGDIVIRLDNLEGRFDNLEGRFDRMQDDITEIKHRLSEKVDRDEFNKMEKRMVKLEKLVFAKLT
ncbi:MAG: hypothetical protein ACD_15C00005G0006 [uncultured bacterium]|nr:MAG: hypothetical protein ACD_15C00005G0006 [uncultured bacterium]HCU70721.1 hypothetical protein [Candidatus Moranbacteria bacterium]